MSIKKIDSMAAASGRMRKEDDTPVNIADLIEGISTAVKVKSSIIDTDKTATWANNAAAGTTVNVDFTKPAVPRAEYLITVYNPSAVTDLTVKVMPIATNLAGSDRPSLLAQFTFPKGQTTSKLIHGIFNGIDVRFALSNDTGLGAVDGFTSTIRVREV